MSVGQRNREVILAGIDVTEMEQTKTELVVVEDVVQPRAERKQRERKDGMNLNLIGEEDCQAEAVNKENLVGKEEKNLAKKRT